MRVMLMFLALAILVMLLLAMVSGCGGPAEPLGGGFMEACSADEPCRAGFVCMTDYALTARCVAPVDVEHCGEPGQPCCKSRQSDGTIARPCTGENDCRFYCAAGLRCDGSHRTGPVNVCVVD